MRLPLLRGRVAHVFGDDFDVDQIVGVRNIKVQDVDQLAALALERCGNDFAQRCRPGDFLLAGRNFGYGHPHFQPMRAMRKLGVAAVLADSFFSLYWRGEISNGFPQVACEGISDWLGLGDEIEVDLAASTVLRCATGEQRAFQPYSATEAAMLQAGGFRQWLRAALGPAAVSGPERGA